MTTQQRNRILARYEQAAAQSQGIDGAMPSTTPPPHSGLRWGDAVALIAQPVARALDAVLGTDLQHCGGCAERHERWNRKK